MRTALNVSKDDKLGSLFSQFVSGQTPVDTQAAAAALTDEVFADKDTVKQKIFTLRQCVGKLSDHELYSPDTADRIEYLESRLASREESEYCY